MRDELSRIMHGNNSWALEYTATWPLPLELTVHEGGIIQMIPDTEGTAVFCLFPWPLVYALPELLKVFKYTGTQRHGTAVPNTYSSSGGHISHRQWQKQITHDSLLKVHCGPKDPNFSSSLPSSPSPISIYSGAITQIALHDGNEVDEKTLPSWQKW